MTHPTTAKARFIVPLLIIGLILAATNMRSPIVMIGSIASMLQQTLGLGASDIGLLGALPMPLFALGALIAPMLAKRFGLEIMMIAMTALLTLGVATRVWAGAPLLFTGTLVLSFAIGMLNALTAPFIKNYAPNHIALATGIFSLSMSAIAGISAVVVVPMADGLSWQVALSSWAIFGCMTTLIWTLIYRTQHTQTVADTAIQHTARFHPWRSLSAWQMAVMMGVQSFLFYTVASFLPSIGTSLGQDLGRATQTALIFQLMAPPAILLLTYLIRHAVPTRIIGATGCVCNAVGVLGILMMPSQLVLWSAVMGFGCAVVFTLSLMMFSLRTSSTENARDLSGMVQAVGYFIAMFGPLSMGWLFETFGDWQVPLIVLSVLMLINVPVGFLASAEHKVDD